MLADDTSLRALGVAEAFESVAGSFFFFLGRHLAFSICPNVGSGVLESGLVVEPLPLPLTIT